MRVIHILGHSLDSFVPLQTKEDWEKAEHHSIRFIELLRQTDSSITHELWTLTRTKQPAFLVQHKAGFRIRVFPRDIPIFLPLETSSSLLKAVLQESREPGKEKRLWHIHGYYLWLYDILACLLYFRREKFIAHFRGGGFTWRALPYSVYHYILALPLTLRLAERIFVQNRREMQRLVRWYRIPDKQLVYVPNCTSAVDEHQSATTIIPKIVYVGRLISYKGIEEIVEICQRLVEQGKKLELILVGDGDLFQALQERAGTDTWLKVLGTVSSDRVREILKEADVFVLGTTRREGSPHALIEAQGMGAPAVAFQREGIEDVIANGQTGFLVNSWQEFEERLNKLLNGSSLRQQFSRNALKRSKQIFACSEVSKRVLDSYRSLTVER
jgi:glycosyltransferase involved in cell wall biosynthesis